jgi:hypothetical protein
MKTLATTLLLAGIIAIPAWACETNCQTIPEQESNDEQLQMVGSVDPETCLTVSGTITTGYDDFDQPNPGADIDGFVFQVPPGTQFQVTYGSLDQTDEIRHRWVDLQSNTKIEMQCGEWQQGVTTVQCEGISPSDTLGTIFGARLPEDYTLTVAVGGNTGPNPTPGPFRSSSDASSYSYDGSDSLDQIYQLH